LVAHCIEGCNYSHGAPPAPLPPPCVPDGWTCPVLDPPFDLSDVKLSGSFGDGMVLQRSPASSAVYGTATPGAQVTITLANSGEGFTWRSDPATVQADGDAEQRGTWKVVLPPRSAGAGYTLSASCTGCTNTSAVAAIADVHFGEVWLCRYTQSALHFICITSRFGFHKTACKGRVRAVRCGAKRHPMTLFSCFLARHRLTAGTTCELGCWIRALLRLDMCTLPVSV
jgi:hypothetical protein